MGYGTWIRDVERRWTDRNRDSMIGPTGRWTSAVSNTVGHEIGKRLSIHCRILRFHGNERHIPSHGLILQMSAAPGNHRTDSPAAPEATSWLVSLANPSDGLVTTGPIENTFSLLFLCRYNVHMSTTAKKCAYILVLREFSSYITLIFSLGTNWLHEQ